MCVYVCAYDGQGTSCRSWFSPTMWVLGMEFRSSGLETRTSTLRVILFCHFLKTRIHFVVVCLDSEQRNIWKFVSQKIVSLFLWHREIKTKCCLCIHIWNLNHKIDLIKSCYCFFVCFVIFLFLNQLMDSAIVSVYTTTSFSDCFYQKYLQEFPSTKVLL